jgi:hypothetical protein
LKLAADPLGDHDLVANVHELLHLTEVCRNRKEMETRTLIEEMDDFSTLQTQEVEQ